MAQKKREPTLLDLVTMLITTRSIKTIRKSVGFWLRDYFNSKPLEFELAYPYTYELLENYVYSKKEHTC